MNPFVSFKKRGISLPQGCKDLVDVLNLPKEDEEGVRRVVWQIKEGEENIRRFVWLILVTAQVGTTELVIGSAGVEGTPLRYKKVDGTLQENSQFPSHIRPGVVMELARLAQLPKGPFPKEGILPGPLAHTPVKWKLQIKSDEGDCVLTRVEG